MPAHHLNHDQADRNPPRRLKLTMAAPERQPANNEPPRYLTECPGSGDRSATPPRPSYSPVTPTFTHLTLAPHGQRVRPAPEWIGQPGPVPLRLDENPDAIALRAAISILQLQRQQSLQHIKNLNKMKKAALEQPEAFVNDLRAGKLTKSPPAGIVEVDVDWDTTDNERAQKRTKTSKEQGGFGHFPEAQNAVRFPPINWAKYHIVGEPLDRLHEEQQKRPWFGNVGHDSDGRSPDHVIAAPYRPFVDKLHSSSILRPWDGVPET